MGFFVMGRVFVFRIKEFVLLVIVVFVYVFFEVKIFGGFFKNEKFCFEV